MREDANAIDRLCRLALAEYEEWCAAPEAPIQIFVDGEERACGADGSFDARGALTLIRSGRFATRVDSPPPFRDRRLP